MKIKTINDIEKIPIVWKWINSYYWVTNWLKSTNLWYLIWKYENIDWQSWINSIIDWIKNVKVTYEEYEERKKRDDEVRENGFEWYDWDYDNNPMYFHIEDCPERYWQDKLATVPYKFMWSEIFFACCYNDITYVYQRWRNNSTWKPDSEEYYSTPEVLEVLEKWKEALERWNNPEERQKMIEEYERNNQGKT
jgi:hypothetical protein